MVYINPDTQGKAVVLLPRTLAAERLTGVALSLRSNMERKEYAATIESISEDGDYYRIAGDFSGIKASGEYDYRLTLPGAVLACGVAVFGELPEVAADEYHHEVNYEQYD